MRAKREQEQKEFPVVKKDIKASGRQFDIAEKMSDYPDIDLFFMIMRLRLLYISGQGYTRMKLRTLLKHYGYKRRSAAITKHIQGCLSFYRIKSYLRGEQECDVKEISLDDILSADMGKLFVVRTGHKPVYIPRFNTLKSKGYRDYLAANGLTSGNEEREET